VPLDYDPSTNALVITSIASNTLTLENGKVLVMSGYTTEELKQSIGESRYRDELERIDSDKKSA
jgi:hypothetical protein